MRLSEIITIYLAAGAPFGVNAFLHDSQDRTRTHALLNSTATALAWPFLLLAKIVGAREGFVLKFRSNSDENEIASRTLNRVEAAQADLLASLYKVQELACPRFVKEGEEMERAVLAVRQEFEKYVGLTIAAAAIDLYGPPDSRETELCRIAGRTGEDLLLAGQCVRRRNAARLVKHQADSRTELLHALAEIREVAFDGLVSSNSQGSATRYVSVALLKFYGHAVNLLSLLEDESAVRSVARLLDAECARLRRLESALEAEHTVVSHVAGGEECTPHAAHRQFTTELLPGQTTATQS
ncbi:MAG: hypothetical protein WBP93_11220 [Pyrinomonadaceae bacterium]